MLASDSRYVWSAAHPYNGSRNVFVTGQVSLSSLEGQEGREGDRVPKLLPDQEEDHREDDNSEN